MRSSDNDVDNANFQSTYGILLFGVPNQGMDITSLIPMAEGQHNLPFLMTLHQESNVLRDLHRDFCRNYDFRNSVIISYYETEKSPTARLVSVG
jgi:hypothetical protein